MSSQNPMDWAIILFQKLYVDHYIFRYKPSIQWVFQSRKKHLITNNCRLRIFHVFIELFPLLVCLQTLALLGSCIFLLSKMPDVVWLMDSRFWLGFVSNCGVWCFVYYWIGIGKKRDLFVYGCRQFMDLEKEIRTGTYMIFEIMTRVKDVKTFFSVQSGFQITPKQGSKLMELLLWIICQIIMTTYYTIPVTVGVVMLLELDHASFFIQAVVGWRYFVLIYIYNVFTFYELTRLILLFVLVFLYFLEKVTSVLNLALIFQPNKSNTSLAKMWLNYYRQLEIMVKILEPHLKGILLPCYVVICMGWIMTSYILIRLKNLLGNFMMFVLICLVIFIAAIIQTGWEILAGIYDNSEEFLVKMKRGEADCSY